MEVKRFTGLFLMLLIVLDSRKAVMPTEGRECESHSHVFRGLCFINANCRNVCLTEGFTGGHCEGFRRRCYCTKDCALGSPPSPSEGPQPPPEGPQPPPEGSQPPLAI